MRIAFQDNLGGLICRMNWSPRWWISKFTPIHPYLTLRNTQSTSPVSAAGLGVRHVFALHNGAKRDRLKFGWWSSDGHNDVDLYSPGYFCAWKVRPDEDIPNVSMYMAADTHPGGERVLRPLCVGRPPQPPPRPPTDTAATKRLLITIASSPLTFTTNIILISLPYRHVILNIDYRIMWERCYGLNWFRCQSVEEMK